MKKEKIFLAVIVWLITLVISIGGGFLGAKIYLAKYVKNSYYIIHRHRTERHKHYISNSSAKHMYITKHIAKSVPMTNTTPAVNKTVQKNYNNTSQAILKKEDYKFGGYVNKIVSIIKSHFIMSKDFFNYNDIIAFQISKTGRVYDVKVMKPSGNKLYDARAMEAVKASTPLPAPPKGFMKFINYNNENNGVLVIFNPQEMEKSNG